MGGGLLLNQIHTYICFNGSESDIAGIIPGTGTILKKFPFQNHSQNCHFGTVETVFYLQVSAPVVRM